MSAKPGILHPFTPLLEWRSWVFLVPLLAVGTWLHWPAGADFKADDYAILRYVSDFGNCLADFIGPQYDLQFFRFWRPFVTLSFGIEARLFGAEPLGFFAMNCASLLLAATLLFTLLRTLWPRRTWFAVLVVLLWLSHPASSTALRCWAAGRVDSYYVPPLLLALLFHVWYRRGGPSWPPWIAAIVAIGTKETALGFPLLALAIDCLDQRPIVHRTVMLFGRSLPGARYLLLFPVFLVFRYFVLGSATGGYRMAMDPFQAALIAPEGLWHQVGRIVAPELSVGMREFAPIVFLPILILWIFARRDADAREEDHGDGRVRDLGWRLAAVSLLGVALFGPLVQLLPQPGSQDLRLAYFPTIGILALWVGVLLQPSDRSSANSMIMRTALAAVPLVWLIPGTFAERSRMDAHDEFVFAMKSALRECDEILPAGEPVIVVDELGLARHPYRFLWAFGSVLKPPFHPRARNIVTLCDFATALPGVALSGPGELGRTTRPPPYLATAGRAAFVEVSERGCRVVTRPADTPPTPAEPTGFSGALEAELLESPESALRAGFRVGRDYTGRVMVCTTVGTTAVRTRFIDGVVPLLDIVVPILDTLWIPADLDKDSPVFLLFERRPGGISGRSSYVGRLEIGPGFGRACVESWLDR